MLSFRFHDLRPYEGKSAAVKRPRELTTFSFDDQHQCFPQDDRSLRYYYPPFIDAPYASERYKVDLRKGFETFVKYDDSGVNLHLNPLLDTLRLYEGREGRVEADVLTWRGMMTKILAAPYDGFGEFEMNATVFDVGTPTRHCLTSSAD